MNFHDFIRDREGWQTLTRELLFENPYLQVYRTETRTPTRPEGCSWTVVHRKAAVVVVPMTASGELVMVRQERVPIRATIWEFPAGQIEESSGHEAQILRDTGLREMREEAGYELAPGGELTALGHFFPSCGFTDEHSHLFLARPVVRSPRGHEHDEHEAIVEASTFSLAQVRTMIARGEICDANTLAAWARMSALGMV